MSIRKVRINDGSTKWEVRYYLGGRGTKRYKRKFDTRADADAYVEERAVEKRQLKFANPATGSFEDRSFQHEAAHWMTIQGPKFSPAHLKRAKGVLNRFLPSYGKLNPNCFHAGLLTKIQSELMSEGLRPATVNRYLEVFTAILNFSAKQRRIPFSPSVGFEKLREVQDDLEFWEKEEAQSFLAFSDQKYPFGTTKRWKHVVYLLAINTALRAGEMWGLQPSDIKQKGEILHIPRQFDRVSHTFRPTKGKVNRRVPCNSVLYRELHALVMTEKLPPRATIFRTERGSPICHDNFKDRSFDRDVMEWGGKRIRLHDLRHTGITLMIASGLDLKTVQEIAGHQDIKTTMRYAHLLADRVVQVARTFSVVPEEGAQEVQRASLRLVQS